MSIEAVDEKIDPKETELSNRDMIGNKVYTLVVDYLFSRTLEMQHRSEIGLQLVIEALSADFKTGTVVILCSRHCQGNLWVLSEIENKWWIGSHKARAENFSTRGLILSGPTALQSSRVVRAL